MSGGLLTSLEINAYAGVLGLLSLTALHARYITRNGQVQLASKSNKPSLSDKELLAALASTENSPSAIKHAMQTLQKRVKDPASSPPGFTIDQFLKLTHYRCFPIPGSQNAAGAAAASFTPGDDDVRLVLGVPILDVRSPGEYDKGHIPGAHSLPLFDNEERANVGTR